MPMRAQTLALLVALLLAAPQVWAADAVDETTETAEDSTAPPASSKSAPGETSKPAPKGKPAAAPAKAATPDSDEPKRDLNPKQAADLFASALNEFHSEQFGSAAGDFYIFLTRAPGGTDNYGWAQYFMGECLYNLGYTYAAQVYYYLVAKTRSQPEVLVDTLSRLESITHTQVFDEELIYKDLVYDGDFGVLPPNLSSWVGYVQGKYDYRRNSVDWGERHFKVVDKDSPYMLETEYVRAVAAVRARRDTEALARFNGILKSPQDALEVKNRAQLAKARLQFEQNQYDEAIASYDQVTKVELSFEDAEMLTEKAWSAYYKQDYAHALGLLHALRAPSYDAFFFPESYLLSALIYKDLCHYLAAKNMVRSFRFKFSRTLEQLKQRLPMEHIDRIRRATAYEGELGHRSHLLQALRQERLNVASESGWYRNGLQKHMRALYDSALKTHDRLWHEQFAREADVVSLRLLDTVEQMNILDYEISLDIYKPLDDRTLSLAPTPQLKLPDPGNHNYYEFDGEYWNEELGNYRFYITSRCFGTDQP